MPELPGNLTGQYRVRALRPAFHDARHFLPRTRDRAELRRHALKLRFWPQRTTVDDHGELLDLNWSWIKSLPRQRVGELRIDDVLGDHDNLRVIFFVPPSDPRWMPMIWVLSVFQKRRDDFTKHNISTFRLRRQIVLERFYTP